MTQIRYLTPALFLLAATLLGCSKNSSTANARLSGSLTYNGTPIRGGTMAFHTADGAAYSATINDDGTYTATDIPQGELVVTVDTESLNPARKPAGSAGGDAPKYQKNQSVTVQQRPGGGGAPQEEAQRQYIKIPSKYNNPKTSPLTVNAKGGRQVENIELKD